jgi:WD40 repeat protein
VKESLGAAARGRPRRPELLAAVAKVARAVAAAHERGIAGKALGPAEVGAGGELDPAWTRPVAPSLLVAPEPEPEPEPPAPSGGAKHESVASRAPEGGEHELARDRDRVRALLWLVIAGEEKGERPLVEVAPEAPAGLVALADADIPLTELADRIERMAPAVAPSKRSLRLPGSKVLLGIGGGLVVLVVAIALVARSEHGKRRAAERAASVAHAGAGLAAYNLAEAAVDAANRLAAERFHLSAALHGAAALARMPDDPRPGQMLLRATARGHAVWAHLDLVRGLEKDRDVEAPVIGVTVSGDGTLVLTAARAHAIKMWRPTGDPAGSLIGHKASVTAVALSRDGKRAASAAQGELFVWHVDSRRLMQRLPRSEDVTAADLALSSDGAMLASAEADGSVILWPLVDPPQPPRTLPAHRAEALAVAFAPTGDILATAGADGAIRLWEVATGRLRTQLAAPGERVHDLAFSPDGTLLASAGADRTVALWDVSRAALAAALPGHDDAVDAVAFTPDGALVIGAGADGSVRGWFTADHAPAFAIDAHDGGAGGVIAVADPDGTRVVSGGADGRLRVWRLNGAAGARAGARTLDLGGAAARVLALSPDGARLHAGTSDGRILRWEVASGKPLPAFTGHAGAVLAVTVSRDGKQIASAGGDGTARLWDERGPLLTPIHGHRGAVTAVAFAPDGAILATGGADGTVRLWKTDSTLQIEVLRAKEGAVTALAFAPDGARIAAASAAGWLEVWKLGGKTAEAEQLLKGEAPWRALAFSPDGATLVAAERRGVDVFRVAGWTREGIATARGEVIHTIRIADDGARVLLAGADRLRLHALPSGDPLVLLPVHTSAIELSHGVLAWSDGTRLQVAPLAALREGAPAAELLDEAEARSGLELQGFRPVHR